MSEEENLTKAEKKQLKRQEKLEQKEHLEKEKNRKKIFKKSLKYSLIILIVVFLVYSLIYLAKSLYPNAEDKFREGQVHWHASFSIFVCGEYRSLAHLGTEEHHEGLPLLHTHGDNLIHVEGKPVYYSDITLGKFFKAIKIAFDNNRIMEKVNNDKCPDGKEGELKVLLNGNELENPVDYSVKDSDKIEIRFE